MSGDTDEEGWGYALNFHNSSWHGCYQPFRSFVRRRQWIRLRCKKGVKKWFNAKHSCKIPHEF